MKQKRKFFLYVSCLAVSGILVLWFLGQTVLFLLNTAAASLSFAEAAKKLLRFAITAYAPAAILCVSVVFSAVGIKLSVDAKQKKIARGSFVAEMVLLSVYALMLLSMFVVFPEEWT